MRLLEFFRLARRRTSSAETAKQRLQVLVALDRSGGVGPDFLPLLQRELLDVIRKYVEVDPGRVKIDFERGPDCSILEVNVELPTQNLARRLAV
ncbi:Cell division topological specificity factor [bacterium HR40]|nr:Cell division topological specificity factor [bacterium HR40]